jgi:hypothetical protein
MPLAPADALCPTLGVGSVYNLNLTGVGEGVDFRLAVSGMEVKLVK